MSAHRIFTAALLLGTATAAGARPSSTAPYVERLADGTELVVAPVPTARTASLRYVVRTGGADDPAELAGIAHMLEHAVFHGNYTMTQDELFARAREHGATINASTSPDSTIFQLDAPAEQFEALASDYLRVITNPALTMVDLEQERGVIASESALTAAGGLTWIVDALLFPGVSEGAPLIGTRRSRTRMSRADLARFYSEHYRPANISAVLTGAIDVASARALIETHTLLPPSRPDELPARPAHTVHVPASEKVAAPIILTVSGYKMDGVSPTVCRGLAALAQLRMSEALLVERPRVSTLETACLRLRGHQFILTTAYSRSSSASQLPAELTRLYGTLATSPPSVGERKLVRRRASRARAQLARSPASLADALARAAVYDRDAQGRFDAKLFSAPPALDEKQVRHATRRCFKERNSILLHLTPFEGR